MTEIEVFPSAYWVSVLPAGHPEFHRYAITMERTSTLDDIWAVRHLGYCLSRRHEWDYEPNPSARTRIWLCAHRFTGEEARAAAMRVVRLIQINGRRPIDLAVKENAK